MNKSDTVIENMEISICEIPIIELKYSGESQNEYIKSEDTAICWGLFGSN